MPDACPDGWNQASSINFRYGVSGAPWRRKNRDFDILCCDFGNSFPSFLKSLDFETANDPDRPYNRQSLSVLHLLQNSMESIRHPAVRLKPPKTNPHRKLNALNALIVPSFVENIPLKRILRTKIDELRIFIARDMVNVAGEIIDQNNRKCR